MTTRDSSLGQIAAEVARITAENTRLLQSLAETEGRFRLLSRGVVRVQEAERSRISRELHDGVGQSLTALKMQIELLEQQARAAGSPLLEPLGQLRALADGALQEVRQLSRLIRPQMLDELGLLPTLQWLTRTLSERTGIAMTLAHEGIEERLDADVETLAFRVAQEALTNVAKHAGARAAEVQLRRIGERLHLAVEDHGTGFDAAKLMASADEERTFGLRGMRDRVHLLGGRFSIASSPERGTRIEVDVPLVPAREVRR